MQGADPVAEIGAVRRCQDKENLILFPLETEGGRNVQRQHDEIVIYLTELRE
jgi:hypothetical protein